MKQDARSMSPEDDSEPAPRPDSVGRHDQRNEKRALYGGEML